MDRSLRIVDKEIELFFEFLAIILFCFFSVQAGNRRECCDIVQPIGMDSMAIKLRTCMKHEIIA